MKWVWRAAARVSAFQGFEVGWLLQNSSHKQPGLKDTGSQAGGGSEQQYLPCTRGLSAAQRLRLVFS